MKGKKDKIKTNTARPGQTSFVSLAQKGYLLGAVALLMAALAGFVVLQQMEQRTLQERVVAEQARLSTYIQVMLGRYVDRVNLLVADPTTLALVDADARIARQERERELAAMIDAIQVKVFGRGEEKELEGEYPRLTFSELGLVYAVEEGGKPRIEFHALTDGTAHLDIVRPLARDGQLVGYVLARFDAAILSKLVNALESDGLRLELVQVLSNGATEQFISWGDDAIKAYEVSASGGFKNADWRLNIWQQPRHWHIYDLDWRMFYGIAVIIMLAVLGVMLLTFVVLAKRAVLDSSNELFDYVRERLGGQWMGKQYVTRLLELQPTLEHMQNLNWSMATATVIEQELEPEQGIEVEESVAKASEMGRKEFERNYIDVLYHSDDAIEVEEQVEATTPVAELEAEPVAEASLPLGGVDPLEIEPEVPSVVLEPQGQSRSALEELLNISSDVVNPTIFRAYDIRGVVGDTLTAEVCTLVGKAFGTEAWRVGEQTVVVARDGRNSSEELCRALVDGLRQSGRDVIDLGLVPTSVLYFATHYLNARSGVMVTGSHNPPDYNGMKLVLRGETLSEEGIQDIYQRIVSGDFSTGGGSYLAQDLVPDYVARISSDCRVGRLKVVIDCGHGAGAEIAPELLRSLGCDVIELYCEVDGNFPAHHPDPSRPENLHDLIVAVREHQADIGLALDGDGDRLGVVDSEGNIIWPDRQLMLYAMKVLEDQPGALVLYDVKCSRHLHRLIEMQGGRAMMWKTGHSVLKAKLRETDAALAGEMSGHIFFNDRWYGFDDGLYCAARLLEILAKDERTSAEVFAALPNSVSTPEILVPVVEGRAQGIVEQLSHSLPFPGAQINNIDGIRAEFSKGWGLIRASNTTPSLVLRFEAEGVQELEDIQMIFRQAIRSVAPDVEVTF